MFFITNRFPVEGPTSKKNREFTFDMKNNEVGRSMFFCETGGEGSDAHVELTSEPFFEKVSAEPCGQYLFYVHGFNVTPAAALENAGRLQKLLDSFMAGAQRVLVIPLIWPTAERRTGQLLKNYTSDQSSADMSAFAFSRVFARFFDWSEENSCKRRMNMLAHSMGNRVLRESLLRWKKDFLPNGVPLLFRNVFLVAADVVNETLETQQPGQLICHAAKNVTVYYSAEDLALRASKVVNIQSQVVSRRLGHTGPERIERTLPDVYAVDCDDFAMEYDPADGHTYFLEDRSGQPGKVFEHILFAVQTGRVKAPEGARRMILRAGTPTALPQAMV